MNDPMPDLRDAYLAAAEAAIGLLARDDVAEHWHEPSACAGWSVGGLAGHLGSQTFTVVTVLAYPVGDEERIPIEEHYARAAWVNAEPDDEVNASIRRGGEHIAADGPHDLVRRCRQARDELAATLPRFAPDHPVLVPWQGWVLTLDDFLTTRMMEIAVHADDLATSLDVETPGLPAIAFTPVLALLCSLATTRHGQAAVLRALARPDRVHGPVSAFS